MSSPSSMPPCSAATLKRRACDCCCSSDSRAESRDSWEWWDWARASRVWLCSASTWEGGGEEMERKPAQERGEVTRPCEWAKHVGPVVARFTSSILVWFSWRSTGPGRGLELDLDPDLKQLTSFILVWWAVPKRC